MVSINHHYIPELFLKGFTANNGRLQVYNKLYSIFERDKKTPRTVFYEKKRNIAYLNDVEEDNVEKMYSQLESGFGELFNLIRNGVDNSELTSYYGLQVIKKYIAVQFWRLPSNDQLAEMFIDTMNLQGFGNRLADAGIPFKSVNIIKERLLKDKDFRHYFKCFYLPILTFDLSVKEGESELWRVYDISDEVSTWDNFLCSDNPFLIENLGDFFEFKAKLIIPLSKNKVITYSPIISQKNILPPIFTTNMSMLLYAQTDKYIAGANRPYITKIIELFNSLYGDDKIDKLRQDVFKYI